MNGNAAPDQPPETPTTVPLPPVPVGLGSPEWRDLNAKYERLHNEIGNVKVQIGLPIMQQPGKMFAIAGVTVLSVAAISIFANWAWAKAFPGMPERAPNRAVRTASTGM